MCSRELLQNLLIDTARRPRRIEVVIRSSAKASWRLRWHPLAHDGIAAGFSLCKGPLLGFAPVAAAGEALQPAVVGPTPQDRGQQQGAGRVVGVDQQVALLRHDHRRHRSQEGAP